MNTSLKPKTARSFCSSRVIPAIAALALTVGMATTYASPTGQAQINGKLTPAFIPGLKTATTITKATSADLLTAIALVLNDPAPIPSGLTTADVAASALEPFGNAVRKDKDKIAGQIIATAIATDNLGADANAAAAVVAAVFDVNGASGNSKFTLTTAGKGAALAAGAKAATSEAVGEEIGTQVAVKFNGSQADLETILVNAGKALGSGASAAAQGLKGIAHTFLQGEIADSLNTRKVAATNAAAKLAATVPAAAGAILGGYFDSRNLADRTNNDMESVGREVRDNPKLAKALGEIIANISVNHTDEKTLLTNLFASPVKPLSTTTRALLTQGVLRVSEAADVVDVLGVGLAGITDRSTFGGIVAVGTGDDLGRVAAITGTLASGQDVTTKTKILTSVATALGQNTPDAAKTAAATMLLTPGFGDDASRTKLATDSVGKIKSTAAAGAVAAAVIEANIADAQTPTDKVTQAGQFAAQIMAKGTKAATDIAREAAELSAITGNTANFAVAIVNANTTSKKFATNAAVGVSVTDPVNAGAITIAVIKHNVTGDKGALAAAAKIGGAVAAAVDAERATDIAKEIADNMSVGGKTSGKPINLSLVNSLATALGKAIQTKAGLDTKNRMDELGEIAAVLTKFVIGKNGPATDTKAQKAETKLLTGIGTALIKTLSKKPFNDTLFLQADLTEAGDIAGGIAQVISNLITDTTYKNALLGSGGALEKAFAKLAGKAGTPDNTNVVNAIKAVREGTAGTKFEEGNSVIDPETDTRNG